MAGQDNRISNKASRLTRAMRMSGYVQICHQGV